MRNLFIGFIIEEQRRHSQDEESQPGINRVSSREVFTPHRPPKLLAANASTVVSSSNMVPAVAPIVPATARSSPLLTPLIPLHFPWKDTSAFSPMPQSPMPMDMTPTLVSAANQRNHDGAPTSSTPSPIGDYFGARTRLQSLQTGSNPVPSDDFSGWSGPSKQESQTPSTPGGLMGRLKNFGKLTKKPTNDAPAISTPESAAAAAVGTPAPPLVSFI